MLNAIYLLEVSPFIYCYLVFTAVFRVRIQRLDSFLFKVSILFNKNNMGSTKRMGIQR